MITIQTLKKASQVAFPLLLNICASCGTIFINKHIFNNTDFHFGTLLTVFHFYFAFIVTFCLGYFFNAFKIKKLPILNVLSISLTFCGYVVFNNISLLYNSVSFYQVMKIVCTPTIIGIQFFFYKKKTKMSIIYSLIPVCIGIFITVVTDFQINLIGTIIALFAVVANSMYTIFGKTKQNEMDANPMQLLLYQSICSGIILTPFIFFFDDRKELFSYSPSFNDLKWVFLSGCSAYLVNFSFFLLVGKTSPLTVNIVGYLKTVIVFVGGFLLFDGQLDFKNVFGISLTLVGVFFYTKIKMEDEKEKEKEKKTIKISQLPK